MILLDASYGMCISIQSFEMLILNLVNRMLAGCTFIALVHMFHRRKICQVASAAGLFCHAQVENSSCEPCLVVLLSSCDSCPGRRRWDSTYRRIWLILIVNRFNVIDRDPCVCVIMKKLLLLLLLKFRLPLCFIKTNELFFCFPSHPRILVF